MGLMVSKELMVRKETLDSNMSPPRQPTRQPLALPSAMHTLQQALAQLRSGASSQATAGVPRDDGGGTATAVDFKREFVHAKFPSYDGNSKALMGVQAGN